MLTFVIPTWNRPEALKTCVESITSQIKDDSVRVIVQDDHSDETPVFDHPAVEVRVRQDPHADYSNAFRDMFRAAPESEWVWTFGDDDILREGALEFMLPRLAEAQNLDFIHVAERQRASGTNNLYYSPTLINLCGSLGWIEMTGFITGNITRGHLLAKAAETPNWKVYAKSAYVQSCALLELLKDSPCAFYDKYLVDTQDKEMTQTTGERWATMDISTRYLWIVDAIDVMFENGILTDKLPSKFFRYLNVNMWDRFIYFYINDFLDSKALWTEDTWGRVARFARFLDDEDEAKAVMRDVEAARGLATLALYMEANVQGIRTELTSLRDRHVQSVHPYTFCEAPANA